MLSTDADALLVRDDAIFEAPLVIGAVGLAALVGLVYAFWPRSQAGGPITAAVTTDDTANGIAVTPVVNAANMTPTERVAAHVTGQTIQINDRQFIVQPDGTATPAPIYTTVEYAGQPLIVESDGAVNLAGAPASLSTAAGRVSAGLVGATVVSADRGPTGVLTLSTQGWVTANGANESTTGNAPIYKAGTPIEQDDDSGHDQQYGVFDGVTGWYRIHVVGKGPNDAYSWFWVPISFVTWDPPGTRMLVMSDGSLSKLLANSTDVSLPQGTTTSSSSTSSTTPSLSMQQDVHAAAKAASALGGVVPGDVGSTLSALGSAASGNAGSIASVAGDALSAL